MKKKIILGTGIILLIVIIITIAIISKKTGKIIYYSKEHFSGFIGETTTLEINSTGKVKFKEERTGQEDEYKEYKLSKENLTKLIDLIKNIENSKLDKKNTSDDMLQLSQTDEYIDLNKKIILEDHSYYYTGESVNDLHTFINEIKQSY